MNSNLRNSHREPLETSPSKFSSGSRFLRKNSLSRSQNFDDGSAKISNHDDSHNIMSPHLPDISHDHSESNQKKIEANFKHTLSIHEIGNIIEGKRNRKPPEPLMNNNSNSKQIVQHNHHQATNHTKTHVPKPVSRPESSKKEHKVVEIPKQKASTPQNRRNEVKALNFSEVFVNGKTRSQKRKMSMPNPVLQHQAIPVKKVMREPIHAKAPKVEEEVQEESSEEIENEEEDFRPKAQKVIKGHEVNSMRSSRAMELARREKEERKAAQNNLKNEKQNNLEEEKVENRIVPNRLVRQVAVKEVNMEEFLKKEEKAMALNKSYQRPGTYMNCDLRYFNFDFLVDKLGYFDVILMDPPWRIKGAQQNDSSFMFSNSKFNLEYDTLSNQEIINLKVERLSKKGFLFLWILSNQINVAYEMLNKWGYEVVDQIVWVKLKDSKVYLSHGYYFMHSFEMCLVGYKCPPGESIEYNTKICNDVMFGEVRTKSRKPDELYEIIDFMMPGSRKIELFARNHNLRPGWFSLGNQLGETFEKWHNEVQCNNCAQRIYIGIKRYKSRYESDYDLCEKCFKTGNLNPDDFFMMNNLVNEDVLHHYHSCNNCLTEPIWGTRFTCQDCENFDLCECCYDKNLRNEKRVHDVRHNFKVVEVPILANGLPAHRNIKCAHCFQKPIIGVRFKCSECPNLSFCQNCFFSKPQDEMKKYRGHKQHHNFQILAEPVQVETQIYKCNWCEIDPIQDTVFKCENCFSFFFCEKCFAKKDYYKPNTANTHKYYHTFVTVDGSE